tara:strand:- start:811 stop:1989 length:1179 start_codon:yes stop_codon:yes gene_type:complete
MIKLREHQATVIDALREKNKGQIIVPTGGGKTMCMIKDAEHEFTKNSVSKTIVVVAPRILLAQQLCEDFLEIIDNVDVLHIHSGETHHKSTTKTKEIEEWYHNSIKNLLIFTTYHSLHKISESPDIEVDTIYFDEAHNSVQKHFVVPTEYYSIYAKRCYFFTATPKHSKTPYKIGMNDEDIYGKVLCNIPAPELVQKGHILPPKVLIKDIDVVDDSRHSWEKDCDHLVSTIDETNVDKILVCARRTRQIIDLVSQTDFVNEMNYRGYSLLYITSKHGAFVNGVKVNREDFFNTLHEWGEDKEKRFIVLHHSILSEGINVKGLEAALFLRNMDYIGISQTIGRVIRKGDESKTYGLVVVPCYDKVGISTSKRINAVVDTVFNKGQAAISVVSR